MSLPAGVLTRPVRLSAPVTHTGEPLTVRVTIEPSHTVVHAATGTALARIVTDNTTDPGTGLVIAVPVTDQPGFIDTSGNSFTGWAYTASIELLDAHGKSQYLVKKFNVPASVTDLDLMMVPGGNPAAPVVTAPAMILSVAGATGVVTAEQITAAQGTYLALAANPAQLFVGVVTRDAAGAAVSADVVWPDGTAGEYTGTPSATFAGAIDSYTITYGDLTYTQPAVTRDPAGNLTNRPAITV